MATMMMMMSSAKMMMSRELCLYGLCFASATFVETSFREGEKVQGVEVGS